jgi:hypothetical protein
MSFPNKPLVVSNGISEASDEENESLMDDSKGVEHGGQAESRSNERCVDTYSNKSRIVRKIAAAAFALYLLVIKLNRPHKPRANLNTTSTGAAALRKHAISLASIEEK